jgi:hypothetical protein
VGLSILAHLVIIVLIVLQRADPPPETMFIDLGSMDRQEERLSSSPEAAEETPPEVAEERAAVGPTPTAVPATIPAGGSPQGVGTISGAGEPEDEDEALAQRGGLTYLRGPIQPLVATPYGIGRRTVTRDEARIARVRAESLINAMIASVVEVKRPATLGPLSFPAGGGVSIPIPWGGFVRGDREDATWREERCRGDDKDEGDKPGEGDARRGQCG